MDKYDYERIILLISKRLRDTITLEEFEELNKWIYSDDVSARVMYEVLIDGKYRPALRELVGA
ncbi:MAG: hypothetical protein J7527_06890 [Chitinophagaceae bacterium]|nr:hypothetical protein [Chitinophagaceae bacterium]